MALTLTVTIAATGQVITTEHDKMTTAHRYLERFAASKGWYWAKHKVAANQWEGRFTPGTPTGITKMASFVITK